MSQLNLLDYSNDEAETSVSGSSSNESTSQETRDYEVIFNNYNQKDTVNWTSKRRQIGEDTIGWAINDSVKPLMGANDVWDEIEIYDGRVIKILENSVHVECLVDKENEIFEIKEFYKLLLENINLELGAYVNIRILLKKGKSTIVIKDGSKLVNREPFEKIPELDNGDLEPVQITEL